MRKHLRIILFNIIYDDNTLRLGELEKKLSEVDLDTDDVLNITEETVETNDDDDEYEYTDLVYGDPNEDEYLLKES